MTLRETGFARLKEHPRACLPGTCYLLSKAHAVELDDLSDEALLGFMKDVQLAARALKEITGTTRINDELHGNTVPHLHIHLFPRTPDDPFPGQPIGYGRIEPPVYQSGEFEAFIAAARLACSI